MLLLSGKRCAGSVDGGTTAVTVQVCVTGSMSRTSVVLTAGLPSVGKSWKGEGLIEFWAIGSVKTTTRFESGETLMELSCGEMLTTSGGVASSVTVASGRICEASATPSVVLCDAPTVPSSGP